jgi:hypothetical protein
MKTTEQLNNMYDTILELELCTVEELELVTSINGFNEQAMNDIVYVREGYNTLDQYVDYIDSQLEA